LISSSLTGLATEIEKLRQESEALKKIRNAMGTPDFPQLVFDKVYKDDINRLLSMDEMWKTRRPPQPIDYKSITEKSKPGSELAIEQILKDDQRAWNTAENVAVFQDR
jgi:ubiquitin-like 1-activating enzyme E1 B